MNYVNSWKAGEIINIQGLGLEVIKEIGRGGMGSTWLLRMLSNGVPLVGKIVLPGTENFTGVPEDFRNECKISLMLEPHSHIAVTLAVDRLLNDQFTILMEYVPGLDLFNWLRQKRDELMTLRDSFNNSEKKKFWSIILTIAIELSLAMYHLHINKFSHRDFKTSNIRIKLNRNDYKKTISDLNSHEFIVKIVDFGLAKMDDTLNESPTDNGLIQGAESLGAGTRIYAPPEQMGIVGPNTIDQVDTRIYDIFSFGVILCEMISVGARPFDWIENELTNIRYQLASSNISIEKIENKYKDALRKFNSDYLYSCPTDLSELINYLLDFCPYKRFRIYNNSNADVKYPDNFFLDVATTLMRIYSEVTNEDFTIKEDKFPLSNSYLLYETRSTSLFDLGLKAQATTLIDKAISMNVEDETSLIQKGMMLEKSQMLDEALIEYENAIRVNNNSVMAWDNKGRVLYHLGKYEESVVAFDGTLKLDHNRKLTICAKGEALIKLEKYQEAIEAYDVALIMDPAYRPAIAGMSRALQKLNQSRRL